MVEVFGTHTNGPIIIEMTLLTTNEIAELVVFTDDPLLLCLQHLEVCNYPDATAGIKVRDHP